MKPPADIPTRNPGPPFGYEFLNFADCWFPKFLFNYGVRFGSAIAWSLMTRRRSASIKYLSAILGRSPRRSEALRHFEVFAEMLVDRLRLSRGILPKFFMSESEASIEFEALCRSPTTALFGTFHVGQSDLMGCMLSDFGRTIGLVRHRVANSLDTDFMEKAFREKVRIIWVNDQSNFLFELKEALEGGCSIGLQCDRTDFGGKLQTYNFLGQRRKFSFTIYRLANLLKRPVAFAFAGMPQKDGRTPVFAAPIYNPTDEDRQMEAAKEHFQGVLALLEDYLRTHPYIWFNFDNPESSSSP